jgi:N-methylhydantoinase A
MILGIDVGGTFTDFVLLDDAGQVRIHKLLTSARDPSLAILQGIADLGAPADGRDDAGQRLIVVHGSTVSTNALLERRGAPTALITTEGFRDVLEIGRQNRDDLYALEPTRPAPLVPPERRFEVRERVDHHGAVLIPLDPVHLDRVVEQLLASGAESVAVSLLFSFLNPSHEQQIQERVKALAGEDAPFLSLSSQVLPEFREYERTSTTVINAYVGPLVDRYLANLERGLAGCRLRIMQSNGGIISAQAARDGAARTALSGPAGGAVGALEMARLSGFDLAITFDMGGTSTDVSLCPGQLQYTTEGNIAGLPLRLPIIDIHTVGAGGGSIARVDEGGALRVGPQSAGSDPGPVCYGRGTEITVTDANLCLGRLDAARFLGGRMALDLARAQARLATLAGELGVTSDEAAWGVIRVANSNMERAIRTISVERGYDPRRFTLVAFGGAGPLHACELAESLHIPRVLVPLYPGVLSALGMLCADVIKDYSQTVMLPAEAVAAVTLDGLFAPLYARAQADLEAEGFSPADISSQPALDMRYVGQSYELTIGDWELEKAEATFVEAFHAAHRQRFSYASEDEAVEIVNLRLRAAGRTPRPRFPAQEMGSVDPSAAHVGYKQVHFAADASHQGLRPIYAALYERDELQPGNIVVGPAVIFQLDTTTVIPPDWSGTVDRWRNLVVEKR